MADKNSINVLINAVLDKSQSVNNIKKQLEEIERDLSKNPIKIKIQMDARILTSDTNKTISEYKNIFGQLNKEFDSAKNTFDRQFFQAFDKSLSTSSIPKSAKDSASIFEDLFARANTASSLSSVEEKVLNLNSEPKTPAKVQNTSNLFSETIKAGQKKIVGDLPSEIIKFLEDGVKTIYELDASLTRLSKSSEELGTSSGVKRFAQEMNRMAVEAGHSTKASISAVSSFKDIGYSLEESGQLAKSALIYSNVADVDVSAATKSMVSILKGFNMSASETVKIIDQVNEVGNRFSITSAGIGEALQQSSSALFESNNSLEESIGLITAANADIQDPAKVGGALKTLALNIRGISEESGKSIPKIDALVKSITGVSFTESNGTFKSTYDIMVEISRVWESLSNSNRATLLEAMFGKGQEKIGNSLLSNMKEGTAAMEAAMNSAGSAAAEQEKYMDSLQAKANTFSETVKGLWIGALDSEVLKFFMDAGIAIASLVGNIGLLNTGLLLTVGYFSIIKGMSLAQMLSSIVGIIGNVTKAIAGLNLAFSSFTPLLLVSIILGAVGAFKLFYVSVDEQKQKLQEVTAECDALKGKIAELKSISNPTEAQKSELDLLERQLDLQNQLVAAEKQKLIDKDVFGKGVWGKGISGDVNKDVEEMNLLLNALKNTEKDIENYKKLASSTSGPASDAYVKEAIRLSSHSGDLKNQLKELEISFLKNKQALMGYSESASGEAKTNIEALSAVIDESCSYIRQNTSETQNNTDSKTRNSNLARVQAKSQEELDSLYKRSTETITSFQSSTKGLASIYEQLNSNEKISGDTILDLIQKYPEYAVQLANINSSKEDAISLTQTLFEIEKSRALQKLEDDKKELESELYKIDSVRIAYEAYLKAISSSDGFGSDELKAEKRLLQALNSPEAKAIQARIQALNAAMDVLKNRSLPDFNAEKSSTAPSQAVKTAEIYRVEKDRYMALTQTLKDVSNALELNQSLQEQAGNSSIELLEEEIRLLDKKRKAVNDITWEQKKEANDIRYVLETGYDIGFDDKDLPDAVSYDSLVESMANELNSMNPGEAHDSLKAEIDSLKESYKRYVELVQTEIPRNTREIIKAGTDISNTENEKIATAFKNAEKATFALDKALDNANNTLKGLSDSDFDSKIEAYNKQKKAANDLLWYWNEQMKLFSEGSEEWNKAKEYAEKFKDTLNSANKSIEDLSKKQRDANISLYNLVQKAVEDKLNAERVQLEATKDRLEREVEEQYKAAQQKIENEKKAYNKIYDVKKNALQREKDLLSQSYDEQKYKDELEKKQSELSKLQASYRKIATDNSGMYAKEQLNLKGKITDKQKEINDFISEHIIKKQQNSFDEQIRLLDEEKAVKENIWQDEIDSLEKDYKEKNLITSRFYREELEKAKSGLEKLNKDSKAYADTVSAEINKVFSNSQDGILLYLISNLDEYKNAGRAQAEAYLEGYLKTLNEAGITSNSNPLAGSSTITKNKDYDIYSDIRSIIDLKQAWESAYSRNNGSSSPELSNIESKAKQYYENLPYMYYEKLKSMNYEQAKKWFENLPRFDKEGFIGNIGTSPVPILADSNEFILKKSTLSNIFQGNLSGLFPKISLPGFPAMSTEVPGSVAIGNLNVNVSQLINDSDYDTLAKKVQNAIVGKYKYTNNVTVQRR